MCQKQLIITLAMACHLCFLHFSSARPVEMPTSDSCPPVDGDCEQRINPDNNCSVCAFEEGEACDVLFSAWRCKEGYLCLPINESMEESENNTSICKPDPFPGLDFSTMSGDVMEEFFAKLAEAEESAESYAQLMDELWRRNENHDNDRSAHSVDTTSRKSSNKHSESSKLHRNKLPRKFAHSQTPCREHKNYVSQLKNKRSKNWVPRCDSEGFYNTKKAQCFHDNCWCVGRKGFANEHQPTNRSCHWERDHILRIIGLRRAAGSVFHLPSSSFSTTTVITFFYYY